VAVTLQAGAVRPHDAVVQGPDAGRRGRRRQGDFGHVAVVHGDRTGQRLLQEGDEGISAGDDATARIRRVHDDVVGEHLAHARPVLGVHRPEVARLELLDRLDIVHARASGDQE
jgi:hypothetical protein